MRFSAIVLLALMSVQSAAADDLFTNNTMFMRVQCEIGAFAKEAKSADLEPAMKADVDFSWTVEQTAKAKASAGWHWMFGGATVEQARGFQNKDKNQIARPFNIHEGNTEACQTDRLSVPLGIKECLMSSIDALKAGTNVSCERSQVHRSQHQRPGRSDTRQDHRGQGRGVVRCDDDLQHEDHRTLEAAGSEICCRRQLRSNGGETAAS